jgi:hypothetical protein
MLSYKKIPNLDGYIPDPEFLFPKLTLFSALHDTACMTNWTNKDDLY